MSHAIANNEKARSQELVPGSGLLMLGAFMRRMPHNEISRSEIELSELRSSSNAFRLAQRDRIE